MPAQGGPAKVACPSLLATRWMLPHGDGLRNDGELLMKEGGYQGSEFALDARNSANWHLDKLRHMCYIISTRG
jgi:hypothetical protein